MKISTTLLPMLVIAVLTTAEAIASSAGGGIYVPVTAVHTSGECPTGHCRNGSTCGHCARLGFACVDGATEAPCTANGGCYPKRPTFGHYNQKWRTWPGEVDPSGPSPTLSEEESLLKPYDAPPAEKEDQQAPPPIEDSVDESGDEIPSVIPSVEIELPPLPRSAPDLPSLQKQPANNFNRPGPPANAQPNGRQPGQRPPAPPFGLVEPSQPADVQPSDALSAETLSAETLPAEFSANEMEAESNNFASRAAYVPSAKGPSEKSASQRNLVKHVGESPMVKKNSPPALPVGFTATEIDPGTTPMIRRLPVAPQHRLDKSVQPVAAFENAE